MTRDRNFDAAFAKVKRQVSTAGHVYIKCTTRSYLWRREKMANHDLEAVPDLTKPSNTD
jgi:hypothetical protein